MKNNEVIIKSVFWTLMVALVTLCVYYIVHNAQWFIGDDAVVIRHTGFGRAFLPNDHLTFNQSSGRFFPLSYLAYDVLLLFNDGYIAPRAHYILHSVFFVVFSLSVTLLLLRMLANQRELYRYLLAFLAFVVFVGRVYPQYTECFATSWCTYTLMVLFVLCLYLFHETKSWVYAVIALLCINYSCYCGESYFVLPLSMGVCALLFQRRTLTKREKAFNWLLIGSAMLFLALYAILVLPYIESTYDGAHGTSVGMLENAFKMLWAQKLLVLALLLFIVRVVDMVKNKKEYTFYDNLLLTAAAFCCGNFLLRLNWTLYYNVSALLALPAILYFSIAYLKEKWTIVLFVLLALLYGYKIPTTIQKNQEHRRSAIREITELSNRIDEANAVYLYSPELDSNSFISGWRSWGYDALTTYLGWIRHDPEFSIASRKDFQYEGNTIWMTCKGNKELFPDNNNMGELMFNSSDILGYYIKAKNE